MVSWLVSTSVVECCVPPNVTVEFETKFEPLMVRVCEGDPATREDGDSEMIDGIRLPGSAEPGAIAITAVSTALAR
jgi:hypothetical protein